MYIETRRSFLDRCIRTGAVMVIAPQALRLDAREMRVMKTTRPENALVLWFSQTGHTERIGRILAGRWRKAGLKVTASDIRGFDINTIASFDLIAAGSPVFYYEPPEMLTSALEKIPAITGTPVAAYSTFGGPGNNQHNTAFRLLDLLSRKGGVPAGLDTFGNMSTFAPTWSSGRTARILKYGHLPNDGTYEKARLFAASVLSQVATGREKKIDSECTIDQVMSHMGTMWWTRKFINEHTIEYKKCILCGICVDKCPAGAIDLGKYSINSRACVACMGCVNNCPTGAHNMVFMGSKVYGFREFLKRNNIDIKEPVEALQAYD
jgi:ferredoxin/flavodoxin